MIAVLWVFAIISLLLMPPIALAAFLIVQKKYPNSQSKRTLASAGVIVATVLAVFFRVNFIWGAGNVIWLLGCYLAYCLLVASCLQIRKKLLRWVALLISAVPIALGYVVATIGRLGVLFLLADTLAEPSYSQIGTDGLTCSVTGWGGAWGDSGYRGSIYESWIIVPFLQREVAWISVDQSTDSVARSNKVDLPTPVHDKDFCTQLMSVAATQI